MVRLEYGLWYPDEGDCAACIAGQNHQSECVGVQDGDLRTYYHGYNWAQSVREAVENNANG